MNTVEADALGVRAGFTQIPNAIYQLPLTRKAITILNALLIFKWDDPGCFPSRKTLMEVTKYSERSLVDGCQELRDFEIVEYKRQGYGLPNYYKFLDPDLDHMIKRILSEPIRVKQPATAPTPAPTPAPSSNAPERGQHQAEAAAPISMGNDSINQTEQPVIAAPALGQQPNQPADCAATSQPDPPTDQPTDQQIEPVSPTGSISAKTARHSCAEIARHNCAKTARHDKTQKRQDPITRSTIIPPAPAGNERKDDDKKSDLRSTQSDLSDPIVKTYEKVTGNRFNPNRDAAALAQLHKFHFIAVLVGIISTSLNAKEPIRSLAYCVPQTAQMEKDKAPEQSGYVGFALSKLAPNVRAQLLPLLAAMSWPRGWENELAALQSALAIQRRRSNQAAKTERDDSALLVC